MLMTAVNDNLLLAVDVVQTFTAPHRRSFMLRPRNSQRDLKNVLVDVHCVP